MSGTKVPVGAQVIYHTNKQDKEQMKKDGASGANHLPAQVVLNWQPSSKEPMLNVKVNVDGPGLLHKTSVKYGHEPGQWSWSE